MFCTNCGAALPDDAKFCTSCGAPAPLLGDEEVAGSGEGAPVDVDVSALDEPTKLEDASAPKRRHFSYGLLSGGSSFIVLLLIDSSHPIRLSRPYVGKREDFCCRRRFFAAFYIQRKTKRAITMPMILAIVILIVNPKVITRIPKFSTRGESRPKDWPKFSQDSPAIPLVAFPMNPPSTIPASIKSRRTQKFLLPISCSP